MMINVKYLSFVFLFFLCSCKSGNASSQGNSVSQDTVKAIKLPIIPVTMTDVEQRADFFVRHYWDNVNFADTNYIHHPEITEQTWVDYCDLLNHVPLATVQDAMKEVFKRAAVDKKVLNYFEELADKYLYDPNSPMRNEEFYIPVLESIIVSPVLDDIEKIRPRARLELAQKNRIGTKALDFAYTLASGAQGTLYSIQAEYTLLFINNPGCHACTETIEALKGAPVIGKLIAEKKLKVLSLYPDKELDEWKKHLHEFPVTWTNGYDKSFAITEKNLYDLKAIPTLYLLDKSKTVLLKDATAGVVEEYLTIH